ncbi:hypothetical protein ACFFV7_44845 [Nonomuraea spiralis]|uniref:Uncharacterized protein n=1 Tax=Nonomuraea spiralis TaxID=46182 RepID=A0ABV5IUY5_9ACTN|nr:hypothetical protein [Nonomuraea spiralis]GGS82083.1 hypothetical protein GCM10010176_026860 [Nonomuraea spiralis]
MLVPFVPVVAVVAALPFAARRSERACGFLTEKDVPAVTRASPELRAAQAAAWSKYGGGVLLSRYGTGADHERGRGVGRPGLRAD